MTHIGQLVRVGMSVGRIWEVESLDGNWAELLHRESGARCQITVGSLVPVEPVEVLPQPEALCARHPMPFCWLAIAAAAAFIAVHVWAAARILHSAVWLDSTSAAVAIASSGAGWSAWFVTMLWMTWRRR